MSIFENKPWHLAMQDVENHIQREFGEPLTIIPMIAKPNYQPLPDPAKAPVTLTGVFSLRHIEAFTVKDGSGLSRQGVTTISSRDPIVSFALKDLPFPIRHLFRIRRERDGVTYEVTDVQSDGVSSVKLKLVQVGLDIGPAAEGEVIRDEQAGRNSERKNQNASNFRTPARHRST